jgi:hypothetical protein
MKKLIISAILFLTAITSVSAADTAPEGIYLFSAKDSTEVYFSHRKNYVHAWRICRLR